MDLQVDLHTIPADVQPHLEDLARSVRRTFVHRDRAYDKLAQVESLLEAAPHRIDPVTLRSWLSPSSVNLFIDILPAERFKLASKRSVGKLRQASVV